MDGVSTISHTVLSTVTRLWNTHTGYEAHTVTHTQVGGVVHSVKSVVTVYDAAGVIAEDKTPRYGTVDVTV